MNIVSLKCPNCGAFIRTESENKPLVCSYCGTQLIVDAPKTESKSERAENVTVKCIHNNHIALNVSKDYRHWETAEENSEIRMKLSAGAQKLYFSGARTFTYEFKVPTDGDVVIVVDHGRAYLEEEYAAILKAREEARKNGSAERNPSAVSFNIAKQWWFWVAIAAFTTVALCIAYTFGQ